MSIAMNHTNLLRIYVLDFFSLSNARMEYIFPFEMENSMKISRFSGIFIYYSLNQTILTEEIETHELKLGQAYT